MGKCYICGEKYAMNICMGCGVRYCNDCYSNLKTEIWSGDIDYVLDSCSTENM
jgi:hypothetical protein